MSELILLGAGASVEAGIPGAYEMTKRMLDLFEKDWLSPQSSQHSRILKFTVGGLLFQQGITGINPYDGINIEDLFNAVQMLAIRHTTEIAPFVGSWHPLITDLERASTAQHEARKLKKAIYESLYNDFVKGIQNKSRELEQELERFLADKLRGRSSFGNPGRIIADMIKGPFEQLGGRQETHSDRLVNELAKITNGTSERGNSRIFSETNDAMIGKLVEMVWVEDHTKVSYLHPLISSADKNKLTIATLNYDNTVELAASVLNIPIDTGIETWSSSGTFLPPDKGIQLLKLHGSIDWSLSATSVFRQIVKQESPKTIKERGLKPALIFGQKNKLTAKGPFLDLLRAFKDTLTSINKLTVIGYSFRDEHINEFIGQWLSDSPDRKLRIINGKSFADYFVSQSPSTTDPENKFLFQLSFRMRDRIEVIPQYAGTAIKSCYSE